MAEHASPGSRDLSVNQGPPVTPGATLSVGNVTHRPEQSTITENNNPSFLLDFYPDVHVPQAHARKPVSLPEGIDLSSPVVERHSYSENNDRVERVSYIGKEPQDDGSFVFKDSLITTIYHPEPLLQKLRRGISNVIGLIQGHYLRDWNKAYPTTVTTTAISASSGQFGNPTTSHSPSETIGYEILIQRRFLPYSGNRLGDTDDLTYGILVFPNTRAQAEMLHANAVKYMMAGNQSSAVIRLIKDDASQLGIKTKSHGYYLSYEKLRRPRGQPR